MVMQLPGTWNRGNFSTIPEVVPVVVLVAASVGVGVIGVCGGSGVGVCVGVFRAVAALSGNCGIFLPTIDIFPDE